MADRRNIDAKTNAATPEACKPDPGRYVSAAVVQDIKDNLDPETVARMLDTVVAPSPTRFRALMRELVDSGVRTIDLADFYIPEVARILGDRWCSDETSFADVTIGVARLQGALRSLGPQWSHDHVAHFGHASILLVVPKDVHHTLGALVLGGQLRRKGYAIKLMLGGSAKDVAESVSHTTYDAVFISSSRGETLESLRKIVEVVNTSAKHSLPVVVGGSILEVETENSLTALTGADYATRSPEEALRLCGLQVQTQHDAHRLTRS